MPSIQKRSGILLCYPYSERRLLNQGNYRSSWSLPAIADTKLDGERCRAVVETLEDGRRRCLLYSSTEEFITTVPHINTAMLSFPDGEYDGELYVHGWTRAEIHSVLSTVRRIHPRSHLMEFHIFDLVNGSPQIERAGQLVDVFTNLEKPELRIKRIERCIVYNISELMEKYDLWISQGYEGFILRNLSGLYVRRRSPMIMKYKPKKSDTYPIHSINEAIAEDGTPKGMVGAFVCKDDMGTEFRVGAGKLSHDKRREIWALWQAGSFPLSAQLKIEYQALSSAKGVPEFSRALELIY